jgi:hypothetical protein
MRTAEQREYHKNWEKENRRKKMEEELLLGKHCPFCEQYLKSEYHLAHPCSGFKHKERPKVEEDVIKF